MESAMRWILWTVIGLVALVGVVTLVGWLLPVKHEASRSTHFNRPPELVYATIADVASYATWVGGASRVEMLGSPNGKIRFREHMNTGPLLMEVDEAIAPSRFVTRIAEPDDFGGTWTFEITPEDGGSKLTITERGEVYNPIFRFMSRFVFGYTATMDAYLASLTKKLA
jgi:hypothetical protein